MIESLLLAVTRVGTFAGATGLTNATGFFFERGERLFLVTNRHVVRDDASAHRPDRIEIELHVDPDNMSSIAAFSIPLYGPGEAPVWREGADSAGPVDVVAVELDRAAFPEGVVLRAFAREHMVEQLEQVEVGTSVLIVGFPLGFHDTLHHLPVARQAVVASAFGVRFQGHGYFLTDARLHRGTSGAPVVARAASAEDGRSDLPWRLLGVHATRLDVANRDAEQDARLDLNCAWYADILLALTHDAVGETTVGASGEPRA